MIKRQHAKKGSVAKVTFELPADAAQKSAAVVGDFNGWDEADGAMKRNAKKKVWTKTFALEPGKEYRFRYLIDGVAWANDDEADRMEANPFGSENGVLVA